MAIVTPSSVPTAKDFDVSDSFFFQKYDKLPSPEEVRSQALSQYQAGTYWGRKDRKVHTEENYNHHPCPAVFESLGLLVKWGSGTRIEEGQTLYVIDRFLKGKVPVPEIYGWRIDGRQTFLYMELLHGTTLDLVWDTMEFSSRVAICREIRTSLNNLGQLIKQDPEEPFIGTVSRTHLTDRGVSKDFEEENGPFGSVFDFHDWFSSLPTRLGFGPPVVMGWGEHRKDLPDDSEIVFTQGDLHPSNILISSSSPPRLVAILDWEQAGWLPDYWEYLKTIMTAMPGSAWVRVYIPIFVDKCPENTESAWHWYRKNMGAY